MDLRTMTLKIFDLSAKRSGIGDNRFTTQDYVDACAYIYDSKKMELRVGRRHLASDESIEKLDADLWKLRS